MSEVIRRHLNFYGRVQGVGFRYYAKHKARQLGLTGWVRNMYDGSVEMEIQGKEFLIDELLVFLSKQTYILIENMTTRTVPTVEENGFYEL